MRDRTTPIRSAPGTLHLRPETLSGGAQPEPATSLRPAIARYPSWAARFETLVERLAARLEPARERLTDWGFCHGDLHGGNAHVTGDQLRLFDFDFCGNGWRVYDLATYRWAARLRGVEERKFRVSVTTAERRTWCPR